MLKISGDAHVSSVLMAVMINITNRHQPALAQSL